MSLIPDAATIAFLGAIELLLSAVVADGMTGRRHRSNIELIAQGVANIGTAFLAAFVRQEQSHAPPQMCAQVVQVLSQV